LGDREAVVARELTKIHESFHRGPITRLIEIFTKQPPKGEIVLIIDRGQKEAGITYASIKEAVEAFEEAGLDSKSALKKVAKEFGISKSEAYRRLLSEK
jgi:16S rRNA (cytidine1402-2'-O)-methyltransferase